MTEPLGALPIGGFLAGTASTDPAPGAGSAAAVTLALGLGCARKAIALTLKHHPEREGLAAVAGRLAALSDQALAGGEADMRHFGAYIAALQRPLDDAGRARAEHEALNELVAIGDRLVATGDEARDALAAVRDDIYPAMANDVAAALALIAAARAIHRACVAESVKALNP